MANLNRATKVSNLIIAGIGGQGINSLANILAAALLESGYSCQFTVHKGGAQSLGSVFAEFRIAPDKLPTLGQGIPRGQLNSLIALEPWEALRHIRLANKNTHAWIENQPQPLFVERSQERLIEAPKSQLQALPVKINWRDYREAAIEQYSNTKMANYLAGQDCLKALEQNKIYIEPALFDKLFRLRNRLTQVNSGNTKIV